MPQIAVLPRKHRVTGKSPVRSGAAQHSVSRGVKPRRAAPSLALIAEAETLASVEIASIDHPNFHKRGAEKWLEEQRPETTPTEPRRIVTAVGMAFVSGLVQAPLLSPARERYLFLKMNFLKFQAERWRRQIRVDSPDEELISRIHAALAEAMSVRNEICEANLRLVVAVAKKLSNSIDQLSELTSEGLLPLMRAVELFNVHLGNRFSTYATWAVRNQMHRALKKHRLGLELSNREDGASWISIADSRPSAAAEIRAHTGQKAFLKDLVESLNERERRIVAARFGLDGEPAGQSLAEISTRLGLSKERVRQIVLHAVSKLRQTAESASLELPEQWGFVDR